MKSRKPAACAAGIEKQCSAIYKTLHSVCMAEKNRIQLFTTETAFKPVLNTKRCRASVPVDNPYSLAIDFQNILSGQHFLYSIEIVIAIDAVKIIELLDRKSVV